MSDNENDGDNSYEEKVCAYHSLTNSLTYLLTGKHLEANEILSGLSVADKKNFILETDIYGNNCE